MRTRNVSLVLGLAIALVAAWAGGASAAGINITGPSSTTATASNLTLTGSAVGTVVRNTTLNVTRVAIGRNDCTGTRLVLIAVVTSGSTVVLVPAGASEVLLFPNAWTVNIHCTNGVVDVDQNGDPVIYELGISFQTRLNAITQPVYTGSFVSRLNAAGSTLTIASSSLVASPGGSSGSLRGTFGLSPALSYTLY